MLIEESSIGTEEGGWVEGVLEVRETDMVDLTVLPRVSVVTPLHQALAAEVSGLH